MLNNKNKFLLITPEKAINMSFKESLRTLQKLVGRKKFQQAFDINKTFPSPVASQTNGNWLKKSKIIAINPRIAGSYWNIVKYAFTLPENAIHILPLWLPGTEGCLYSIVNWDLNDEFIDQNLINIGFDTSEKQLKLVINVLHALDKCVGFDIPLHTDKFSELVFVHPYYFEWIKLNKERTDQIFPPKVDNDKIHKEVETTIIDYLKKARYAANNVDKFILDHFFDYKITEQERIRILFGTDPYEKLQRRLDLMNFVRLAGFETVPVTEHMPNRPIVFDKMQTDGKQDWASFKILNPSKHSNIFQDLTPFKLYEIDEEGYTNVSNPNESCWNYIMDKITKFQQQYNFDFLRADMAHRQISHSHSNTEKDIYNKNEIWARIKENIRLKMPYFAMFAEAFCTAPGYICHNQDMENKKFDIVLGTLHYTFLNQNFFECLKGYITLDRNFDFCATICTFDSESHIYADLYKSPLANEVRAFVGLFSGLPGYINMGFETKDLKPTTQEFLTGHYIKKRFSKYRWGSNVDFFETFSKMRKFYINNADIFQTNSVHWLEADSPLTGAWIFYDNQIQKPSLLCALNLDTKKYTNDIVLNNLLDLNIFRNENYKLNQIFPQTDKADKLIFHKNQKIVLRSFKLGEYRIYKFIEKRRYQLW